MDESQSPKLQREEEDKLELPNNNNNLKRKSRTRLKNDDDEVSGRAVLSLTKPSYNLGLGSKTFRAEHRARLTRILRSLMSQGSWADASGVLSVLLQATCKDRSLDNNRFKNTAAMEVLSHVGKDYYSEDRIKNIYDIWMRKIGSLKAQPVESRFLVQLEFIVYCLTQGNLQDAHQAALWVIQENDFGKDPVSNMIVGQTFYQLWYSTIPKELLRTETDQVSIPSQSNDILAYSEECDRANTTEAPTTVQSDSDSSVKNDKILANDLDSVSNRGNPVGVVSMQIENISQNFQPQGFYANSADNTGNGSSISNHADKLPFASFSALEVLDPLLFPIRLPQSTENDEDLFHLHMEVLNDYYKEAVKYLRLALSSTPPLLEALLPFIQLLLVGGQVDEALKELDKFCCNSNTAVPMRLKAHLLEHFDRHNITMLSTCFEDILMKDPTCCHSLEKLITMHRNGDYSSESLLEMIGQHLDATYANSNTWREFASCFLKLSEYEEDRMSVCLNGNEGGLKQHYSVSFNKIPKLFTQGALGKNWRLRCRWWLNRHFSSDMLASEIAKGDLQLPAYKAACASHMYGPEFAYVVEVYSCLDERKETDLFSFLKLNIGKSIQLYSSFKQNNR